MECTDLDSSEREEGEIIDDDLEEISEDSIAPSPKSGKFNSPEENLRAISLSSVSDLDVLDSCSSVYNLDRRKHRRGEKRKRKKKPRVHRQVSSGSSSEDEEVVKTKKLLREALCRDHEEIHNNSLRTRLKKMVQPSILPQEQNNDFLDCDSLKNFISPEPVVIPNDVNKEKTENVPLEADGPPATIVPDVDDELIQLRLEALKTAVVNKFQRKKRKVKSIQEESKTQEVDKENSSVNVNTQSCTTENVQDISDQSEVVNQISPNSVMNSEEEIDEDVLRAELLASIAKKITQIVSPATSKKTRNPNNLKNSQKMHSKTSQKIQPKISQTTNKSLVDPPKISPIIISINNPDSDSDDEFNDTSCLEDLKNDNENDKKRLEMKIDSFLKQQRAEVEAKNNSCVPKFSVGNSKPEKLVKINNDYKFLPQNKQLEYEDLINKLKHAQKKKTRLKLPSRTPDKLQKNKAVVRTTENNLTVRSNPSGSQQKQLRHVQQQVNGRLQEKGKYHELSPLVKKMEQVIVEQKKHETLINKLLKQLNEARSQSSKLQKVFNGLMQEYSRKKQQIDDTTKVVPVRKAVVKPTTKVAFSKPQTKINTQTPHEPLPVKCQIPAVHSNTTMQCKVVLEKCPINLKDPNDIEFKTMHKIETGDVPKYSSPLDYMESKSHKIHNPMEILCPFEMDGLCRDKDCTYNHCS